MLKLNSIKKVTFYYIDFVMEFKIQDLVTETYFVGKKKRKAFPK